MRYLAWAPFNTGGSITNPTGYGVGYGSTGGAASALLSNIVAAMIGGAGLLFLLYLIFGALKYIIAGGDDKAVQEAKKMITNAGVGLGLVVGAFFIADILSEVLGLKNSVVGGITAFNITGPAATYVIGIMNPTGYSSGLAFPGVQSSTALGGQGGLLTNVITAIFVIGGILLLVYLFFGAFKYMTAGGDDKATGTAKSVMTNAIVGIVIMVVSFFIVRIAGTVLGLPNILNPTFPGP